MTIRIAAAVTQRRTGAVGGPRADPGLVYSTAGCSALAGWLKTAAVTVAADGVTINGVLTGRVHTARIDSLDRQRAEGEGRSLEEVQAEAQATIPAGLYGRPAARRIPDLDRAPRPRS